MSRLARAVADLEANPQQWEAFTTQGHCVVLAPPGSGKTKLLTTRLAHDLSSGAIVPPRGAACITMTNEAAGELRRRLRELGVRAQPNLFVGTVHGFALSAIVSPFARASGRQRLARARLASDEQEQAAFRRAVEAQRGLQANLEGLPSTMGRVRRLGDYSGDLRLGGPAVADLARRYESELEAAGVYDFNDLMRHAVAMLREHAWLRGMLVATYPRLYVDEYQDLPPSLDELVRLLCLDETEGATLFAVGDPDQAIYGFMGTRPELLHAVAALPDVTRVKLEINYRAGQDLVDASLQALGEPRTIRAVAAGGDIVLEPPANGPEDQRRRAVDLVRLAGLEGVPHEQIIVLTHSKHERDLLAQSLRAAGMPVYARTEEDYATTPLTASIEALARYTALEPPPARALGDLIDEWQAVVPEQLDHQQVTSLVGVLHRTGRADLARDFVEALVPLGLRTVIADPGASHDARQLQRMRTALSADGALSGLTVAELGERARAPGRVMVATTHGAKGLEFDVVIACDCEERLLPHWKSIRSDDPGQMREERRKFYVMLTRARRRVHFLWSGWRPKKYGGRATTQLSRFVRDLIA